jgi:allophanate hydrolase
MPLLLGASSYASAAETRFALAVVGAHLSGLPLNYQLLEQQAQFVEATTTTPDYRLYALPGTEPPKPGLLRVAEGSGSVIQVEVWSMPADGFGRFTAAVPSPLSIGTVRLAGGRTVKGFLVESEAVKGAPDISSFGGWRNYLARAGR